MGNRVICGLGGTGSGLPDIDLDLGSFSSSLECQSPLRLLTWEFRVISSALRTAHASNLLSLQQAPSNSTKWHAYNAGVKMGCWGLVIYAATAAICSGEKRACPEHWNPDLASREEKLVKLLAVA